MSSLEEDGVYFYTCIDFSSTDHFQNDRKMDSFLGSHEAVYVVHRKNIDHHHLFVIHRKLLDSAGLAWYFDDDAVIARKFTNDLLLFADQLFPDIEKEKNRLCDSMQS